MNVNIIPSSLIYKRDSTFLIHYKFDNLMYLNNIIVKIHIKFTINVNSGVSLPYRTKEY
jgi:hypothetical protein